MTLRFPNMAPPLLPGPAGEDADRMMKNDVFISHAAHDLGAAEAIAAALENSNLRCFLTLRDVPAGMDRAAAIIDAIFETRLFLLVHSLHANRSPQMAREVQLVHDRHIAVFPLRLDDSPANANIEFFLRRQSVFCAVPLEPNLPRLVSAVEARLAA